MVACRSSTWAGIAGMRPARSMHGSRLSRYQCAVQSDRYPASLLACRAVLTTGLALSDPREYDPTTGNRD